MWVPHVGSLVVDEAAVKLIEEWIERLLAEGK
jgi:hypothetical protein